MCLQLLYQKNYKKNLVGTGIYNIVARKSKTLKNYKNMDQKRLKNHTKPKKIS